VSKTTTNLRQPSPRDWHDLPVPVAITICLFALLAIAGLVGRLRSDISAAAVPTPQLPIIMIATQPATLPPTAAPIQVAAIVPNTLRRAVVAYDAPAGNVIGAIEQGRTYQVLARFGSDWLQTDVAGSGVVWLKADQVLDLPADLVDLQPPPAAQVIYVAAEAVATPTPAYEPTSAAQVIEAQPTPVWATVPPVVRSEDFAQPDPKAACGTFVGCLPGR
jgi:hypothetical protein